MKETDKTRICSNKKMLERASFYGKSIKYTTIDGNSIKQHEKRARSDKSKAMELADSWFSRYIRIKYHFKILEDGTVLDKCIITGAVKSAVWFDNGHCFSRANKLTRFDEDNCRPQNRSSNRFSGEADHYKFIDNLKKEIGDERFNRIDELHRLQGEDNETYYLGQAAKYRKLTNKLIKELNARKWW